MKNQKIGTSIVEVLLALFVASLALTFSTFLFSYLHRERRNQVQEGEVLLIAEEFANTYSRLNAEERKKLVEQPQDIEYHIKDPLPDFARLDLSPLEKADIQYLILNAYRVDPDGERLVLEVPLYVE